MRNVMGKFEKTHHDETNINNSWTNSNDLNEFKRAKS